MVWKARSSRNATRHGLLTGAASLLAEHSQELQSLLDNYRTDLRPASTHEDMLVRELAVADCSAHPPGSPAKPHCLAQLLRSCANSLQKPLTRFNAPAISPPCACMLVTSTVV